jgi:hypothetical protein
VPSWGAHVVCAVRACAATRVPLLTCWRADRGTGGAPLGRPAR